MSDGIRLYIFSVLRFKNSGRHDQFCVKVDDPTESDFEGHLAVFFKRDLANPIITAIMKVSSI